MPRPVGFAAALRRALADVAPRVEILDETTSTNDVARALGREGAPHLSLVTAERQRSGRGRLGRAWIDEPGASMLASWVVRPDLAVDRWTLIPLIAGVAVVEAVRARATVEAVLKWPNDVLVGERKLAGILVEAEPPSFLVVGVGLNVSQISFPEGLEATSLALEGAIRLDRADMIAAITSRLDADIADPDATLERYRALCATLGRAVRVERADGSTIEARAIDVDTTGALVLEGQAAPVAAGDVVHLR